MYFCTHIEQTDGEVVFVVPSLCLRISFVIVSPFFKHYTMRYLTSLLIVLSIFLSGCKDEIDLPNTPRGNFEALWQILDEHYCFFKYKQIDWDEVHDRYSARIKDNISDESLFKILGEMLAELKDGHTNLYSSFDIARYWSWFEDYAPNFYPHLQDKYMKDDYQIAGGIRYRILPDNIGYMYYPSFSYNVGESNLDQIMYKLSVCDGIIIDIRNNGGGDLTNVDVIASRFTNERVLVGFIVHKTGRGHDDFSDPYPRYINPSSRHRYQKKVVLLTNRSSYSAANDFTNVMRQLPQVTVIGDKTGGGGGLPFSSELPNGWSVRFSASPMFDPNMNQMEFGIDPDEWVSITKEDLDREVDTILERAIEILKNNR